MYSPQEIGLIRQYGEAQSKLVAKPGAVNHSGTSYAAASLAKWALDGLMTVGGLHVAGPMGMIAGPLMHGVQKAVQGGASTRATLRNLYGNGAAPLFAGGPISPVQKAATLMGRAYPR
jgi:hypothetical protein